MRTGWEVGGLGRGHLFLNYISSVQVHFLRVYHIFCSHKLDCKFLHLFWASTLLGEVYIMAFLSSALSQVALFLAV